MLIAKLGDVYERRPQADIARSQQHTPVAPSRGRKVAPVYTARSEGLEWSKPTHFVELTELSKGGRVPFLTFKGRHGLFLSLAESKGTALD